MSKYIEWLNTVENPITRDDKYFYQIIKRLDKIINLLEITEDTPKFVKPIGTKDEPNEDVTVELIYDGNVDEKLGKDTDIDNITDLNDMTVKELRDMAKDLGLTGYSALNKKELIGTLKRGD